MKLLTLIMWICLSGGPAFAQNAAAVSTIPLPCLTCRSAPAPLIGLGLPAALAVGGVLLGAKFLRRRRQS